ncbi:MULTISPECIES: HAD family phosphatase [unclassified Rhodococcus (in: high G+C Gram-positive bacteria)]|uniref:HAD family hydrolase n=1 Tax=unclassified Rhodococcus (in: high G+C Gram-positive bacteria) TaxID=192944 RepID=UPI00163990B6|nr:MULTISPECIES: HAD family hydrolase [unclassified Rhodococcus (in: high G+C Gram-positive bacteria)]MBC2638322.1 HAD family hydrolase [Rhodococcus sp. 3A]MBC2896937.1 HAD family hydrolase [Rhodococcus sp. 4CII]
MSDGQAGLAGVLWDMDGTLLDSEKMWDVAVRELSLHLGGPMTEETRLKTIGASSANALGVIFDALGLDRDPASLAEAKEWMFTRVEELFGDGIPWRPGAHDALRTVRAHGLRSALVTNTERRLTERALETLGRHHFDHSVCGDEVPAGKPHPDPYLRGAELLGLDPSQCLAIEDSPTGAASAQAAGCVVLVVPCEIPVDDGPGRVFRDSLEGLTGSDLVDMWAQRSGVRL